MFRKFFVFIIDSPRIGYFAITALVSLLMGVALMSLAGESFYPLAALLIQLSLVCFLIGVILFVYCASYMILEVAIDGFKYYWLKYKKQKDAHGAI